MFVFASPYFFLLLAVIPVSIVYRNKIRMHPDLRVSSLPAAHTISSSIFLKARSFLPFLKYAAIVLLIIAMARPQWGTRQVSTMTEGINIILAVDLSESMAALDFKQDNKITNRLEAVKKVMQKFISKRSGDRIGMVVFGSEAYTQLPLTRDYNAISSILERLETGSAGPKTAIGDAIGISVKRLEDIKSKSNIIILLTDGQSNSGEFSPETAAEIALQKNVKIYTIGVGTRGKAPFLIHDPMRGDRYIYRQVDIDENTLKHVAQKTGGLYFRAEDTRGLEKIYNTIDSLEKSEIKVKIFSEHKDLYSYFLALAFILLCLWIVLANTRFLRVP